MLPNRGVQFNYSFYYLLGAFRRADEVGIRHVIILDAMRGNELLIDRCSWDDLSGGNSYVPPMPLQSMAQGLQVRGYTVLCKVGQGQ